MPPKALLLQRWSRRRTARNRNSTCKDSITWVRCNSIFRPMYALCGLELRPAEEMDYRLQRKQLYYNPPWVILLFVWQICPLLILPRKTGESHLMQLLMAKKNSSLCFLENYSFVLSIPETARNCTITHLSVLLVCQSRPWCGLLLMRYDLWVTWMHPMLSQCVPTISIHLHHHCHHHHHSHWCCRHQGYMDCNLPFMV